MSRGRIGVLFCAAILGSCSKPEAAAERRIVVAAAANLTGVLEPLSAAFQKESGIEVVPSFGSTAQLAQQIENGAPFDVFAAADTEHVDRLLAKGQILEGTRAIYARGQLVLWVPDAARKVRDLNDLTRPEFRFIAIAQPELAPYGKAAVEAMTAAGLWASLQAKAVYASSINMARQFAQTGNADAAFTAQSLVLKGGGTILKIDPSLYTPIDQAAGVVAGSKQPELARRFVAFLQAAQTRALLADNGYLLP